MSDLRSIRLLTAVVAILTLLFAASGQAVAHQRAGVAQPNQTPPPGNSGYSGIGAANYANTYWSNYNSPRYQTISNDCTNFVSQALEWGGMPFTGLSTPGYPSLSPTQAWWYRDAYDPIAGASTYEHPNSWTVAEDLREYLVWDNPGGIYEGTYGPSQMGNQYTPGPVVTGDVMFYRWNGGSTENHVSIQVGIGTDPASGWYGNLVDTHTTNHHDAFWSLKPYNSQWNTTYIDFYHIDPSN